MSWYLEEEIIGSIFDLLIEYQEKLQDNPSILTLYLNVVRVNLEQSNLIPNEEFTEEFIMQDELGLIDVGESLNRIKEYYLHSFIEEDHTMILIFVSNIVHSLENRDEFKILFENLNEVLLPYDTIISENRSITFLGEIIGDLENEEMVINSIKMYDVFEQESRIGMVKERLKDALFLYANNRYTACLALMAFALEGFLRGIFGDKYEFLQERYDQVNASLAKTTDGKNLIIEYNNRLKPSKDISLFPTDGSKLEIFIEKKRERRDNAILEIKLKNEYAGLLCLTDKVTQTTFRDFNLESLIKNAQERNLIDDRNFMYESFDFLRKVRNNIVHFDNKHIEITQKGKTKKVIIKVLDFINVSLYNI